MMPKRRLALNARSAQSQFPFFWIFLGAAQPAYLRGAVAGIESMAEFSSSDHADNVTAPHKYAGFLPIGNFRFP